MTTTPFVRTDEGDQTLFVKVVGDKIEIWLTVPGKNATTTYVASVDAAEFAAWVTHAASTAADHTHRVETLHEIVKGEDVYYGHCATCGWRGTNWESRELAQASATGHYVFPEMVVTK